MNCFDHPGENRKGYYLLFWPVFALRYILLENRIPTGGYHEISCVLDEKIPFLEGFLIPYLLWHGCLIGMHLWLYFRDGETFRDYSHYLMVSMGISTAVFLLWPSCQNLRPTEFPRNNLLTQGVKVLYRVDTSTNVFPSEHVIGAAGFLMAACHSKSLNAPCTLIPIGILAALTAVSTVFLKQHSVLDVAAAIVVCAAGYLAAFSRWKLPFGMRRTELGKGKLPGRFSA